MLVAEYDTPNQLGALTPVLEGRPSHHTLYIAFLKIEVQTILISCLYERMALSINVGRVELK